MSGSRMPESRDGRGSQDGLRLDRHQGRQPALKASRLEQPTGDPSDGTGPEGIP